MSKLVPRRMDRVPMINIEVVMYNSNLAQTLGPKRHVCRCLIVFLQGPGTIGFGDVKLHWTKIDTEETIENVDFVVLIRQPGELRHVCRCLNDTQEAGKFAGVSLSFSIGVVFGSMVSLFDTRPSRNDEEKLH